MSRYMMIVSCVCVTLLFLFIKIYRHNALMQLTYYHQHLEYTKEVTKKRYYTMLAQLSLCKNLETCARYAESELQLERLKLAHIQPITCVKDGDICH